ncbi:unnamed protein product [Urochloa humidicola]
MSVQVHHVLMLVGFIILRSEAIMSYKIFPWSHETNKMVYGKKSHWTWNHMPVRYTGAFPTVMRIMLPMHDRFGLVVYMLALLAAELEFTGESPSFRRRASASTARKPCW